MNASGGMMALSAGAAPLEVAREAILGSGTVPLTTGGEPWGVPLSVCVVCGLLTLAVLAYVTVKAIRNLLPHRRLKELVAFANANGFIKVSSLPQYPEFHGTVHGVNIVIRTLVPTRHASMVCAEVLADAAPWPHRVAAYHPYIVDDDYHLAADLPERPTGEPRIDCRFLVRSSSERASVLLIPWVRQALLHPGVMAFIDDGANVRVLIAWRSMHIPVAAIETMCRLLAALGNLSERGGCQTSPLFRGSPP
ncbi:hypothetical protein LZC95_20270 [Pendulispora brunnea]|uniref:Uncharacterized protein n=1 Tax=Pendulispora brunnea TaxID=2905690 RepID=A0ABZ2KNI3_9BACT